MREAIYCGRRIVLSVGSVALAAFAVDAVAIDEVLVTTRKREENLQQVPIAVEAIGGVQIGERGLTDLDRLTGQSPSVILDQGFAPQDLRIVIRGLSPTRGRQNVAVLQDGIDVSSEAAAGTSGGSLLINPRLFDLERVEIVKGPQIALYGRSAFAGAINYITRKPGDTFHARVATDLGSDGQTEFSGSVDGPITDSLSAGITGMVWQHDGFYNNSNPLTPDSPMGDQEGVSVAGTLAWKIADGLNATLRVENLNDEFGVTPYAVMPFNADFIVPSSATAGGVVSGGIGSVKGVTGDIPDADELTAFSSEDPRTCVTLDEGTPEETVRCENYPGSERFITRGTLTLDWAADEFTVTSLTHYADAETDQIEGSEDLSASQSPTPGEFWLQTETNLFSQELRIASSTEGKVSWIAGALYWEENVNALDGSLTCLNYEGVFMGFPDGPQPCGPYLADIFRGAPVGVPGDGLTPLNPDKWSRDTEHWSVYGLVEWEFMDEWKITFEGRQTWEDLTVLGPDIDNGIFDPSGNLWVFFGQGPKPEAGPGTSLVTGETIVPDSRGGDEDDSFFAPKATLTWTPDDRQMYYLSWAQSYKPKGISTLLGGTGAFYNTGCGQPPPGDPDCTDPIAGFRFDQEKLDNYEIGGKTSWLENRLVLNGAVFFQDFKNKQVSTQVPTDTGVLSPRIVNAGAAEVWGAELEATWFPTDQITLSAGYTWLDTEYTDYKTITTGAGTIAYVGNCTVATFAGDDVCIVSYDGNELEGAPEHAWVGSARWEDDLTGEMDYFLEGDFQYQADRYAGDKNLMVFPEYWLFNFRAGLTTETWEVIAYLDNAFDDDTVKTGFEDGDIPTFYQTNLFLNHGTVILPDRRALGVRATYRFGGAQ